MTSGSDINRTRHRARTQFWELLRVEGRLSLREPYALGGGLVFPIALLVLFYWVGTLNPGDVAGSGLTVLELWIPTILVISFLMIGMIGVPVTFARDREIGWLRRLSTTPVPPSRLLGAQLALNFIVACAATAIVIGAGDVLFGASFTVGIEFVGVTLLAIAELFTIGLMVASIAPTQQAANYIAGGLLYPLLFLSGLWIQPVQVGGLLELIMWYSPVGAAARALLYSAFNVTPPYMTILTMAAYTVLFGFVAVRFFRWE